MGVARLVIMSTLMLIATLVASFTPLYFNLSPRKVAQVSTYSTGLLLGAALTIVIPEGVAAVFANSGGGHDHGEGEHHEGEHGHSAHNNASWIGMALLAGFLLMYLIDSVHSHDPPPTNRSPRSRATLYRTPSALSELEPLSSTGSGAERDDYSWEESGYGPNERSPSPLRTRPPAAATSAVDSVAASAFSTVVGLLVHSLADGISLGASSISAPIVEASSEDTSLDLVIFFAIMVHKAPAAFALSSLLSSSPAISPLFRNRSLLAFSLAAPLGAVITYAFLSLVGAEGGSSVGWWTGIALVFSGGTFLFVATSVMKGDEAENADDEKREVSGTGVKMALVMGGMCTPLLLSKLVGHGH